MVQQLFIFFFFKLYFYCYNSTLKSFIIILSEEILSLLTLKPFEFVKLFEDSRVNFPFSYSWYISWIWCTLLKTSGQPLAACSKKICENPENVRSNRKMRLEYKKGIMHELLVFKEFRKFRSFWWQAAKN